MRVVSLGALATIILFAGASGAAVETEPEAAVGIRARLSASFPDVQVVAVRRAPIAGLYEVFTKGEVVYVDAAADYLLAGKLLSTADKRNLSAESWDKFNRITFSELPLQAAIKVVRGNGTRTLAVFTDPDCPFCRDLEKQLATLDDVTIYAFLFPLEELHKGATARARAIWCSSDRGAAWHAWMLESKQPAAATCAMDPVAGNQELGARLNVTVTPTVFFADGTRVTGSRLAADIDRLLRERRVAAAGGSGASKGTD